MTKSAMEQIDEALKLAEEYLVERGIENRGRVGRTVVLPAIRVARRLLAEEHAHKHTAPASHPSTAKSADRCGEIDVDKAVLFLRDNRPDCKKCTIYPEGQSERYTICKYCVWCACLENHYTEFSKDADKEGR